MCYAFYPIDLHTDGTIRETFSDYYDLSDEQFLQEIVALAESSAGTNGKLEDYSLGNTDSRSTCGQATVIGTT